MRTGYIDFIKFLFAIIIAEFHFRFGMFPIGRIAVEDFFMISRYLMMKYIEYNKSSNNEIGISSIPFIIRTQTSQHKF